MKEITLTEIKKLTYKQQPKAKFNHIRNGIAFYSFYIFPNSDEEQNGRVCFECHIPVNDMGDASFYPEMEAKFLLRWVQPNIVGFEVFREPVFNELPPNIAADEN